MATEVILRQYVEHLGNRGEVVKVADADIFDVAAVLKAAVHGAIATAALSLTIEVLIHHKLPTSVLTPR